MANTTEDKLAYLSGTRDTLKTNLIAQGMDVTSETTFRQMAEMVEDISGNPGYVTIVIDVGVEFSAAFINEIGEFTTISYYTGKTTISVQKNSVFCVCLNQTSLGSPTSGGELSEINLGYGGDFISYADATCFYAENDATIQSARPD